MIEIPGVTVMVRAAIRRMQWTDDDGTGETGTVISNETLRVISTTEPSEPSAAALASIRAEDRHQMSDGGHERDWLHRRCRLCGLTDEELWQGKGHQYFCGPGSRAAYAQASRDRETHAAAAEQQAADAQQMAGKTRRIRLED